MCVCVCVRGGGLYRGKEDGKRVGLCGGGGGGGGKDREGVGRWRCVVNSWLTWG